MDFWNTIEEIKEQYFMGIRSAVLENLEEEGGRKEMSSVKHRFL
jgi:hypothetical protein